MKIVFCAYDGKNIINGINAWLIRLLPELLANNINVHVIFIIWAPEDECNTLIALRAKGINCTTVPVPHYTEKQVRWILRYVNNENPDIFVPGNMIPALYASAFIRDAGIATVGVLHNDDEEYTAIINEFSSVLNVIVAVSSTLYQKAKQLNNKPKIYQIPYGAAIPKNQTALHTDNILKVVYIGRIVKEQKRIDEITIAFCKCAIKLPDTEFYIYGSGPDEHMVKAIITAYNTPPNVFLMGNISNAAIQNDLLKTHVIVLMSEYEGLPVALMEAMACGVVPVCKNIRSGIPELVTNGKTGFLIEGPDELSAAIECFKQNPDQWKQQSANCRQLIVDSFSSKKNTHDWLNLINDLAPAKKKHVNIPFNIKLTPTNPALSGGDKRDPGLFQKAIKRIRRTIKSVPYGF